MEQTGSTGKLSEKLVEHSETFADHNSTDLFKARNFVRTSLEKRNRLRQDLFMAKACACSDVAIQFM